MQICSYAIQLQLFSISVTYLQMGRHVGALDNQPGTVEPSQCSEIGSIHTGTAETWCIWARRDPNWGRALGQVGPTCVAVGQTS